MGRFVIALVVMLCVLSTAAYSDTGEVKLIRVDLTRKSEAEILELIKALGYRKVAEPQPLKPFKRNAESDKAPLRTHKEQK